MSDLTIRIGGEGGEGIISAGDMIAQAAVVPHLTFARRELFLVCGILGPDGRILAGPAAPDREDIVYGGIELEAIIRPKLFHDVAGNYNRFDVLALHLNRAPLAAIREAMPAPTDADGPGSDTRPLLDELRRRAGSASHEELRALVASLLAALDAG